MILSDIYENSEFETRKIQENSQILKKKFK